MQCELEFDDNELGPFLDEAPPVIQHQREDDEDARLAARSDKPCWLELCCPTSKVTNNSRYCARCKRRVDRAKMQAQCRNKLKWSLDKELRNIKEFKPLMV